MVRWGRFGGPDDDTGGLPWPCFPGREHRTADYPIEPLFLDRWSPRGDERRADRRAGADEALRGGPVGAIDIQRTGMAVPVRPYPDFSPNNIGVVRSVPDRPGGRSATGFLVRKPSRGRKIPARPSSTTRSAAGRSGHSSSAADPEPRTPHRAPADAPSAGPPTAQHRRNGGRIPANRACTRRNTSAYGQLLANLTHTFRTVTRTNAPIFSSFNRIVWHCARANSVPAQPQPTQRLQKHVGDRREEQPDLVGPHRLALVRSANRWSCCSLIRFSISPRAQ